MEALDLDLYNRIVQRKKVSSLRKEGITPVHLYGRGITSLSLQAKSSDIAKIVDLAGHNIPININLPDLNEQRLSFVAEIQYSPISNNILHVDFLYVNTNQPLKRNVPIYLIGESPAVRINGCSLNQELHSLIVECLPLDTPEKLEIDISILKEIGEIIKVKDCSFSSNITILSNAETIIAKVSTSKAARSARGSGESENADALSSTSV